MPQPDTPFPNRFPDDDDFLRGINPICFDFPTGKIHSNAFCNSKGSNRMSVFWTARATVDDLLSALKGFGAAALAAGVCYRENQDIEATPTTEQLAHCDVVGQKPELVRKRLRDAATLLVPPKPPSS